MTVDSRFLVGHAFANLVALLVRDETAHRRCKYRVHSYIARSFPTRRAVLLVSRVAYDFFIVQLARELPTFFSSLNVAKRGKKSRKKIVGRDYSRIIIFARGRERNLEKDTATYR